MPRVITCGNSLQKCAHEYLNRSVTTNERPVPSSRPLYFRSDATWSWETRRQLKKYLLYVWEIHWASVVLHYWEVWVTNVEGVFESITINSYGMSKNSFSFIWEIPSVQVRSVCWSEKNIVHWGTGTGTFVVRTAYMQLCMHGDDWNQSWFAPLWPKPAESRAAIIK